MSLPSALRLFLQNAAESLIVRHSGKTNARKKIPDAGFIAKLCDRASV